MYFKQILDERCGCASYLIASRQTHEAAIVDPSIDIEQYEALLRERGFRLRYVIDTHVHADHVSGARRWPPARGGALPPRSRRGSPTRSDRCTTARSCRLGSCGCACCTPPATAPS